MASGAGVAVASGLASVLGLAIASGVAFASGLAAGVAAAGVAAGGVGVSVAQETSPADKPRLATIKRALNFMVLIFLLSVKLANIVK